MKKLILLVAAIFAMTSYSISEAADDSYDNYCCRNGNYYSDNADNDNCYNGGYCRGGRGCW